MAVYKLYSTVCLPVSLFVGPWREAEAVWCLNCSCLESHSQGCHLIPLSYLLSCFVFLPSPLALSVLSFFLLMVHSDFSLQKTQIFFIKSFFCMALVKQLGDDSWQVVYMCILLPYGTGICLLIVVLCIYIKKKLHCVCPFLFYIFL